MQRCLSTVITVSTSALFSACVLSPSNEFRYSYEQLLIGKPYSGTVGSWKDVKEEVSATATGGRIIRVPIGKDCTLFYEVENDEILRAWDDGGRGCWKAN